QAGQQGQALLDLLQARGAGVAALELGEITPQFGADVLALIAEGLQALGQGPEPRGGRGGVVGPSRRGARPPGRGSTAATCSSWPAASARSSVAPTPASGVRLCAATVAART